MENNLTLDDIALGDISASDARTVVFKALETLDGRVAQRVYAAFRDWLWKTVNSRRRDDELNDWYELMRRAAARLSDEHFALSERITALYEILYQTVSASEVLAADAVIRRKHVQQIVDLLSASPGFSLERMQLQACTNLNAANLSRIITMMEGAGLLERVVSGRNVSVGLTRLGQSLAAGDPVALSVKPSAGQTVSVELLALLEKLLSGLELSPQALQGGRLLLPSRKGNVKHVTHPSPLDAGFLPVSKEHMSNATEAFESLNLVRASG